MFIRTYGTTLAGNGWNSVDNYPVLNIMYVSLVGEEFLGTLKPWGI
jgi:hypothetical protein